MSLILKRLLSILATAIFFAFWVTRTVLDLIGYATLPDDAVVAQSLLHRFFLWVLTVPSWLTFVAAFGAYAWLAYVSWPRAMPAPAPASPVPVKSVGEPPNPNTAVAASMRFALGNLRSIMHDLNLGGPPDPGAIETIAGKFRATEVTLQKMGYAVPWLHAEADPVGYVERNIEYITKVEPLISAGHEKEARRQAELFVKKLDSVFVDKDRL